MDGRRRADRRARHERERENVFLERQPVHHRRIVLQNVVHRPAGRAALAGRDMRLIERELGALDARALHRVGGRVEIGAMEQRVAAAVENQRVPVAAREHRGETVRRAQTIQRHAADEQLQRRGWLDRVVGAAVVERLPVGRRDEGADVGSTQRRCG